MRLFFMHIPKTAGSSFRRFLERSIREMGATVSERRRDGIWSDDSESYPGYDEILATGAAAFRNVPLVCGHYPFHVRQLLGEGVEVVTVFREPLARCISHVKHQMAFERTSGTREPESDVNAFLSNPRNEMFIDTIANLSVKYLAFDGHPEAVVSPGSLLLSVAVKRALETEFGFAEELAALQGRLADKYFRAAPSAGLDRVWTENRSPDPFGVGDLTPVNRMLLETKNALDVALDRLLRRVAEARADRGSPGPDHPVPRGVDGQSTGTKSLRSCAAGVDSC